MKILDWMHQKVRKGSALPFKDCSTTGPCILKHDDLKLSTYNIIHTSNWMENMNEFEIAKNEVFEESLEESPVIFQGFLSIGFLGLEPIISEPVTPTFNYLTDGQFSVTEKEIKFINEELEKFLENEANEEISTMGSSGRNSQASVISFANMAVPEEDSNEQELTAICPLQDYLFGSTIELPCSGEEVKKKMSLRDLFQENEHSEKHPDENERKGEQNINTKKHNKFTQLSLNKLLKKLKSPISPKHAEGEFLVTSKRNRFNRIQKLFRRKVHPEKNNETQFIPHSEHGKKTRQSTNGTSDWGEQHGLSSTASELFAENKEQWKWIKTDTDYFVLEL